MLQRMHELVGQHEAQLGGIGTDDAVERCRLRVVETRDLLGIEVE